MASVGGIGPVVPKQNDVRGLAPMICLMQHLVSEGIIFWLDGQDSSASSKNN